MTNKSNFVWNYPAITASGKVPRGLPVSFARDEKGRQFVLSRFEDNLWDFVFMSDDFALNPSRLRLDFDVPLGDDTTLLDPGHGHLCTDVKKFIYMKLVAPCGRGEASPENIVCRCRSNLWPILRFMTREGFERFSEIVDFRLFISYARSHTSKVPGLRAYGILRTVEDLFKCGFIPAHPWPGKKAAAIAGYTFPDYGTRTPEIPEEVASRLYDTAIRIVEDESDLILNSYEAAETARREAWAMGKSNTMASYIASCEARRCGIPGRKLYRAVMQLRTACEIVIAMITGAHLSAVLSIEQGCIKYERSATGTDRRRINGRDFKKKRMLGGKKCDWAATEDVERAAKVLERLSEPLRIRLFQQINVLEEKRKRANDAKRREALTFRIAKARREAKKLFLSEKMCLKREIGTLSLVAAQLQLRRFAMERGIRCSNGDLLQLMSRQFRQTKVFFVMRQPGADLHALKQDLKHKKISTTLGYGKGALDTGRRTEVSHIWDKLDRR